MTINPRWRVGGVWLLLGTALLACPALAQAAFDPESATRAYLDSVPADVRARSDAYFEGGYWLLLVNALYAIAAAWVLMRFGLSLRMRALAERLTRWRFVHAVVYGLQYSPVMFLLSLPLSLYADFYREHQYGLATQAFVPWFVEQLVALAVSTLLLGVLLGVIYAVMARARNSWPLWGGAVVAAFLVLQLAISPVFIQPLFNDYKPLPAGDLRTQILAMAHANGVPTDEIYGFDASKQTTRISANVSGLMGSARIALNDNLLNGASTAEIKAVVGHEIAHFVTNLVIVLVVPIALLVVIGLLFVRAMFPRVIARIGASWGVRGVDDPAGFPVVIALLVVFFFVATPIVNGIIRENERMADLYGLNAAREPDGFATVSLKLASYRKLEPSALEEFLFYDHPSGRSRIAMAMRWKAENMPSVPGDDTRAPIASMSDQTAAQETP